MAIELVLPTEKYKNSYLDAISEFSGKELTEFEYAPIEEMQENFAKYVEKLRGFAKGIGLPEGYLPHTEFWLVDGDHYIGRLDIRHSLNQHLLDVGGHIGYDVRPSLRGQGYGNKILELGLPKAKELGLNKVLLTCSEGNIASEKIIVKNGGVYEDARFHAGHGVNKKRFWIEVQ